MTRPHEVKNQTIGNGSPIWPESAPERFDTPDKPRPRTTQVGNLTASDIGATVALDGVHVVEGELLAVAHRETTMGPCYSALNFTDARQLTFASTADCVVEGP